MKVCECCNKRPVREVKKNKAKYCQVCTDNGDVRKYQIKNYNDSKKAFRARQKYKRSAKYKEYRDKQRCAQSIRMAHSPKLLDEYADGIAKSIEKKEELREDQNRYGY